MSETALQTSLFPALHADFRRARDGNAPAWLRDLRAAGLARFEERGLPTPRDEEWRQTSIAPIARASFRPAPERSLDAAALASLRLPAYEVVFVNGRFAPILSSISDLPAGLRIESLSRMLTRKGDFLRSRLGSLATPNGKPFTALNTAFLEDGALVWLSARAIVEKPIHLVFYSTNPDGEATVSHPRTLVVAESGSQAKIVETYAGTPGHAYFTNAVTELVLEDGAVVGHYKIQRESEAAFHVGGIDARQAGGSQLTSYSLSFGGALVRTDIDTHLAGEGADCGLYGLFLGHGQQHVDHHTLIDHAVPRCTSRELYKGILDERARGVFFGTIVVRKDAQKTDAHQTNKNLLLSREALVHSTPRLEIEADDVRCKHGSTTGQLDATALFYLRSRGIGETEARGLLAYAFAADVVSRITLPTVRTSLLAYLSQRLPGGAALLEAAS